MKQLIQISPSLEACCPTAVEPTLARESAEDAAMMMKALGDPNRVQIVSMIANSENREVCVCDLTEPLGLTQPTVSHHLSKLVSAKILEKEKRGTWSWYRLNAEAWKKLAQLFTTEN